MGSCGSLLKCKIASKTYSLQSTRPVTITRRAYPFTTDSVRSTGADGNVLGRTRADPYTTMMDAW